jgi:hypothetical protein
VNNGEKYFVCRRSAWLYCSEIINLNYGRKETTDGKILHRSYGPVIKFAVELSFSEELSFLEFYIIRLQNHLNYKPENPFFHKCHPSIPPNSLIANTNGCINLFRNMRVTGRQGAAVSAVTRLRPVQLRTRGSISSKAKFNPHLQNIQSDSSTYSYSYSMGTGVLPPGMLQRRKTDHSPLSSAEVKNEWSYSSTPTYGFVACRGTMPLPLTF